MNDTKLLSDSLKLIEDKQLRSDIRKLIRFCRKNKCKVLLENDPNDKTNSGLYLDLSKEIYVAPNLLSKPEELIIILLHEIGHMDQFTNDIDNMNVKYPGVMSVYEHDIIEKKWKIKTQKYWIDYVGLEQDAWSRSYDLAKKLNIEIDLDLWTRIRLACLRRAGTWLAGVFK